VGEQEVEFARQSARQSRCSVDWRRSIANRHFCSANSFEPILAQMYMASPLSTTPANPSATIHWAVRRETWSVV